MSKAFLSALSLFLSFDPKIDSLEDLVGVSALAVDESFSTVPFSLSFKWVPPTPSFVSLPPPPTPSLGAASSSRDLNESPAVRESWELLDLIYHRGKHYDRRNEN